MVLLTVHTAHTWSEFREINVIDPDRVRTCTVHLPPRTTDIYRACARLITMLVLLPVVSLSDHRGQLTETIHIKM